MHIILLFMLHNITKILLYNIARCSFCVTVWYLWDDEMFLVAKEFHYFICCRGMLFTCFCVYLYGHGLLSDTSLWFYLCVDRLIMS